MRERVNVSHFVVQPADNVASSVPVGGHPSRLESRRNMSWLPNSGSATRYYQLGNRHLGTAPGRG